MSKTFYKIIKNEKIRKQKVETKELKDKNNNKKLIT